RVLHTGRRNGGPSPSALPGRRARAVLAGGGGRHRKRRRQTAVLVGIWTPDAGRLNQTKSLEHAAATVPVHPNFRVVRRYELEVGSVMHPLFWCAPPRRSNKPLLAALPPAAMGKPVNAERFHAALVDAARATTVGFLGTRT